jgi:hypothetical protein
MAWATGAEILEALAAQLKKANGAADLPAYAARIVTAAVEMAQVEIRNVLTDERGFSESQLVAWRGLHAYHRRLSILYSQDELRELFKDTTDVEAKIAALLARLAGMNLGVDPANPPAAEGGVSSGVLTARADFDAQRARERAGLCPAGGWAYRR